MQEQRRNFQHLCVQLPHTRLTALFLGLPRWVSTRKVKPIWILLKQETVSGNGISWAICKCAPHSRQITMPSRHYSVFFTDTLPATKPNSIKALKALTSPRTRRLFCKSVCYVRRRSCVSWWSVCPRWRPSLCAVTATTPAPHPHDHRQCSPPTRHPRLLSHPRWSPVSSPDHTPRMICATSNSQ